MIILILLKVDVHFDAFFSIPSLFFPFVALDTPSHSPPYIQPRTSRTVFFFFLPLKEYLGCSPVFLAFGVQWIGSTLYDSST
jgi:hypothetical protein